MDNQKYEVFLKTAELGSFKKTAEFLGYTQAGVSYIINALEEDLGMPLFIRGHGGVHLSADGEKILPWIRDVSNSERQLHTKLNDLKSLESGLIRIAAFTSPYIHWLPGMIKAFRQDHPKVEFDLRCCDSSAEIERLVWKGDVDCGFFVPSEKTELSTFLLRRDPMLIVLSKDHPLANAPVFPISALAEYPYIKLNNGAYSEMDKLLTNYDVKPAIAFTLENAYAVMAMVSKGFGFTIFPELILRDIGFPLICKALEVPAYCKFVAAVQSCETASASTQSFLKCARQWADKFYA